MSACWAFEISAKEIADYCSTVLDFSCKIKKDHGSATAPDYRTDIAEGVIGKADVIEEIARLYGYDKIPATRLQAEFLRSAEIRWKNGIGSIQDLLVSLGLQESHLLPADQPGS